MRAVNAQKSNQISLAFAHLFLFYFEPLSVGGEPFGARGGEIADTLGQPPDRCTVEDTSITRM